MLSSIFSGDSKSSGQNDSGSFDLTSFVGSIAGSTQKKGPSGPKTGVENLLDVSSENVERKKFVSAKNVAKPASKPSHSDDKKSKDSKDYGHSSQSHRNGHSDDSRNHKRDDKPRDSSRDHRDSGKSKSSRNEDYNPLQGKSGGEDSFDVRIKKKLADNQEAKNGEYSPKIKKAPQQPSSPKIKKADPSPSKRPDVPSSKPSQSQPNRPNGASSISKSSSQHSSSQAKPSSQRPGDSIAKKPSSGTSSQPPSRPQTARPTSSSPAPSKSQSSKPILPGSLSGKPISKPSPGKPSSLSKPSGPGSGSGSGSGSKPMSNGSMGSKPLSKPGSMGSGSRPVSSQPGVKKDFTAPLPKPSSMRPVSQSPKPVGKPMGGAPPPAGSKEALRRQIEERRRKEEALKGKRPMESAKPGSTNLGKRPLERPDSRHEPGLVKKPMLSMSDKKHALNSIFKGAPKASKKRHYDSEDDDYDDNDSFIDDGDEDTEAMREFGKMMTGYRRRVQMSKPYEDDIDNMEVGYDRIMAEEDWTRHVAEIEDKREMALIEQEMEEERQSAMKKKRKLKI